MIIIILFAIWTIITMCYILFILEENPFEEKLILAFVLGIEAVLYLTMRYCI
jgi:hypothetical protein